MPVSANADDRVTEIVVLLRPERPQRLPESLAGAAMAGNIDAMQLFVDRGTVIDDPSKFSGSPLVAAIAHNQLEAARWLIARGANLEPPGATFSPMQTALGKANCEAAALLLDAGLPLERAAWGVIAAASLGRMDMLLWLLGRGLELDRSYPQVGLLRERAVHNFKKGGDEAMLRVLKGEADPGAPSAVPPATPAMRKAVPRATPEGRAVLLDEALNLIRAAGKAAGNWKAKGTYSQKRETLLCHAAAYGNNDVVKALLEAGAAPNFALDGTAPPLTRATEEAQTEIMRILLDCGALPNGKDGKSWLPLESAVMSGVPEVVKMLLDAGANAKAKPAGGRTILEYVRGPYAVEIRALLENAKPAKAKPPKKTATNAAKKA